MNALHMLMQARKGRQGRRPQAGMTLVELLVAMTIMGVLSTMVLLTWFTLQSSYASSEQNAKQRDVARNAVWRMATEIRDAQGTDGYPPVISAEANTIIIGTSFNNAGNTSQPSDSTLADSTVHRVRFALDTGSGVLYRTEDTDNDLNFGDETATPIVRNVVNANVASTWGASTPVFTYTYYQLDGNLATVKSMTAAGIDPARIVNVHVQALVDIKPNKSPTYMDLKTTVQPRNAAR